MKKSISGLSLALCLTALSACSEGSYTPVTTPAAQTVNPYGYNTGINGYPNGVNPYTTGINGVNTGIYTGVGVNPYFSAQGGIYAQLPVQAQLQFRLQAQALTSCAQRATPNFYYFQQSQVNNCAVRRATTYTPSSCACYQAPCNCAQVVETIRSQCGTIYTSDSHGNSNSSGGSSSGSIGGGIYTSDSHGNATGGGSSSNGGSGSNSGTGSVDAGVGTNSNILPLSITGVDAKALYTRLAKEAVDTKNATKTKIRTGANYKCMMDGKGKDDKNYACDIDVSVSDGVVYQVYPVGQAGVAVDQSPAIYNGTNVDVGGPGLNPDEGYIKIQGKGADFMFKKMTATATSGTVDIAQTIQASIKTGKQVKCYQTTGTAAPVTECKIKVNSAIGEVEAAN